MFIVPVSEAEKIRRQLLDKKETIAIAESVTAGLLQHALSTIPDASKFWQGGITAFNVAQKFKHLQVEPLHALEVNCVSEKVAIEMALHVCPLFQSQWGIGITGYATPEPDWNDQLHAYFAIVYKGEVMQAGKITPSTKDDPPLIQQEYVQQVIGFLIDTLQKRD